MSVKGRSKLYGPYRLSVIGAILRGPHRRPDRHRRLYQPGSQHLEHLGPVRAVQTCIISGLAINALRAEEGTLI